VSYSLLCRSGQTGIRSFATLSLVERFPRLFLFLSLSRFDGHFLEISFFAAANETFAKAFQLIPISSDFRGFILSDGVIVSGLGNTSEKVAKLGNNLVGGREVFEALLTGAFWVFDKVAAGFLTEPFDDARFISESDDFQKAIQRVA
jgi:hypothetical protein